MDRLEESGVVSCRDDVGDVSTVMIDSFMGNTEERFSDLRAERSFIVVHGGRKGSSVTRRFFDANRSVMPRQKVVSVRLFVVCSN